MKNIKNVQLVDSKCKFSNPHWLLMATTTSPLDRKPVVLPLHFYMGIRYVKLIKILYTETSSLFVR